MPHSQIQLLTLAQLSGGQDWRLALAHDRDHHLLIWITRGQGRLLLEGQRRGLGPHNALWIPARSLFAVELGYQCAGHAVLIPEDSDESLPETIAKSIGASSPTTEELFRTAVRTIMAERRARKLLNEKLAAAARAAAPSAQSGS